MKLQHLSTCIGLIATSALAFSVEPARAFNFTTGTDLGACGVLVDNVTVPNFKAFLDDTTNVKNCTTADGFTLTASQPTDRVLQGKMVDKDKVVKGVGLSAPLVKGNTVPVPGEIEPGEILDVFLNKASLIKSIDLSFLYRLGVFGDKVTGEVAEITANGTVKGTLTVTGTTTAVWNLGGTVINLDPSKEVEGGAYSILNPFGDLMVSSLQFTALDDPKLASPLDTDFSLVAIEKTDVPEPATLLGLGVVCGLMAASRRQKSA